MVYKTAERVGFIKLYYENRRCAARAAEQWKNVSRQYVFDLFAEFRATESVANKKRQIEPAVTNEATEVAILGHVELDHTVSPRKLAFVSGVLRTSIRRISKTHKMHPYKNKLTQELNEDDFIQHLLY